MRYLQAKQGISLLALLITIIVCVIISGTGILVLSKNNPINKAKEVAFKSDMKSFSTDLEEYLTNKSTTTNGLFTSSNLQANDYSVTYNNVVQPNLTIKDIIPSLSQTNEYNGQLEIINGQLIYKGDDATNQKWAKEMDIQTSNITSVDINITTSNINPVLIGTDITCTIKFVSNIGINNINLDGNIVIIDESGTLIDPQPLLQIGDITGTTTDTIRTVNVIIKTDTLLPGKYKIKILSEAATNLNGVSSIEVTSNVLFELYNSLIQTPDFTYIPNIWTNNNVTVSITYKYSNVNIYYSFDSITWNKYTSPLVIDTNGVTIYAKAVDLSSNQSSISTLTITNIDKTNPTVEFVKNGGNNIMQASSVVNVSDNGGSGIKSAQFVWDIQNKVIPVAGWTEFSSGDTITNKGSEGIYYLWIKVLDNAGNITDVSSNAFITDITPPLQPTLTASTYVWTNLDVIVTISYSADTVIKEYSLDGTTWNSYLDPLTITKNNTVVYARAKDAAGNESVHSKTAITNIDKILPNVEFVTNGASNIQTASTTVTVSDVGGSDINKNSLQYIWDTQNATQPTSGWNIFLNNSKLETTGTSGNYYLWIKASDNAGNNITAVSNTFAVDTTPPTNPVISASPSNWTNKNVAITITYSSDTYIQEYSLDSITWNKYINQVIIDTNNTTIYARAKDIAGNQSGQSSLTVTNIDKISPNVNFGTNGASNVQIASTTVTVSDTGGSNVNGNSLQYIWDTQNVNAPTSGWTAFTNGDTLNKSDVNGTYYLWIKASDNAGNLTTVVSNSFVIYVPVITNPLMSANPSAWTNTNVIVTVAYSSNSNLKQYSLDGSIWSTYTSPIVVTNNNTVVYARSFDNAGVQIGQSSITITNIDKNPPSTPIVNFNNYKVGKWTNQDITINLTSTDDLSGINKYQYSSDGINWLDISSTYTYNYDVNLNIMFRSVDNAGNLSTNTKYYSILRDTTSPIYSSTAVLNMTSDSYDIYVYGVQDLGSGVSIVKFPTWTVYNGQDDLVKSWDKSTKVDGTNLGNGTWKFTVKRSDHNNEYGDYITNVYIYDNLNNYTVITVTANLHL